jgi:hypothetical protein
VHFTIKNIILKVRLHNPLHSILLSNLRRQHIVQIPNHRFLTSRPSSLNNYRRRLINQAEPLLVTPQNDLKAHFVILHRHLRHNNTTRVLKVAQPVILLSNSTQSLIRLRPLSESLLVKHLGRIKLETASSLKTYLQFLILPSNRLDLEVHHIRLSKVQKLESKSDIPGNVPIAYSVSKCRVDGFIRPVVARVVLNSSEDVEH